MLSRSFLIFAAIGALNTAIDVGLFVTLHDAASLPIIVANTISTSAALCVSYVLNARYTFNDSGKMTRRKFIAFLLVTLTGLWILQPVIIVAALYVLHHFAFAHNVVGIVVSDPARFDSGIAKLSSVPFTLAWNYVWYQKVVFKKPA